jgi:hypothetical protein
MHWKANVALALKFQDLLSDGTVRNHVELARLGHVTRTRVCQIIRLTNLAPAIQEALLFLPKTLTGRDRITEKRLRPIASLLDWEVQIQRFRSHLAGSQRYESSAPSALTRVRPAVSTRQRTSGDAPRAPAGADVRPPADRTFVSTLGLNISSAMKTIPDDGEHGSIKLHQISFTDNLRCVVDMATATA